MKDIHARTSLITIVVIFLSGLIWLLAYSMNYSASIGYDGPAGGTLGMALLAGWITSTVLSLQIDRPLSKQKIIDTILVVFITGIVSSFLCGLLISQYSMSHFPGSEIPLWRHLSCEVRPLEGAKYRHLAQAGYYSSATTF